VKCDRIAGRKSLPTFVTQTILTFLKMEGTAQGHGAKKALIFIGCLAVGIVVGQLVYNDVLKRWLIPA
jgi:hypothetical protein